MSFLTRFLSAPGRRLIVRKEGKTAMGISLFVGLAAVNSGNNLLYLVWGISLGLILVSGVMSEMTLRKIIMEIDNAPIARVGREVSLRFSLFNPSKYWTCFSVGVEILLREKNQEEHRIATWESSISPEAKMTCYLDTSFNERGCFTLERVAFSTAFPFGFFIKERFFGFSTGYEVLVAPQSYRYCGERRSLSGLEEVSDIPQRGIGADFWGLRLYRDGDDIRWVHWKKTMQLGRFVIREFARDVGGAVWLSWDPLDTHASNFKMEKVVALVCGFTEYLYLNDILSGFSLPGISCRFESHGKDVYQLLRVFAQLDPSAPTRRESFSSNISILYIGTEIKDNTTGHFIDIGLLDEMMEPNI